MNNAEQTILNNEYENAVRMVDGAQVIFEKGLPIRVIYDKDEVGPDYKVHMQVSQKLDACGFNVDVRMAKTSPFGECISICKPR